MTTIARPQGRRAAAPWRHFALLLALTTALFAAGCASVPDGQRDPRDPWEPFNRGVTQFNTAIDDALLKPVATAYRTAVPSPVRTGVSNFFGNLSDAWSFVNNVLQAKPEGALHSFWRVVINTTLGLGGVLDPATEMHLVRHREDFGQTLGRWGAPPGPYLVLPFFGPSTVRDALALPVDAYGHPLTRINDDVWRWSLAAAAIVDARARFLEAGNLLEEASLDPYTFTRDAFLQKRQNDVLDGAEHEEEERYDLEDGKELPVGDDAAATPSEASGTAPTPAPRRKRPRTRRGAPAPEFLR